MLIIRIIENILILYFGSYLILELALVLVFFRIWRRPVAAGLPADLGTEYGVSILVPAFNEEITVTDCVRLLMHTDYPHFEVLVISDGSQDRTLERLQQAFQLEPDPVEWTDNLGAQEPREVFRSRIDARLRVVDKPNGGKADALNVGLNLSRYPYVCTLDADSILDPQALRQVIAPFCQLGGDRVVATGGALAVANETRVTTSRLEAPALPRNLWVQFQLIEYLRSFVVSRTGLSRVGGLLVMSGAFTLFRREALIEAGGFLSPFNSHPYVRSICRQGARTVCEDLEVVVRVRRRLQEQGKPGLVVYLPKPICWTEVPDRAANLSRQRDRWQRGLLETLVLHWSVIFEPRYGALGLVAMPYYLVYEAIAPVMRLFAYAFVAFLLIFNLVNQAWMIMLLIFISLVSALVMGLVTVAVENRSRAQSPVNLYALRYRTGRDWLWLLALSVLSDFTYAQIRLWWQLKGVWHFLRRKKSWDKFDRKGFHA